MSPRTRAGDVAARLVERSRADDVANSGGASREDAPVVVNDSGPTRSRDRAEPGWVDLKRIRPAAVGHRGQPRLGHEPLAGPRPPRRVVEDFGARRRGSTCAGCMRAGRRRSVEAASRTSSLSATRRSASALPWYRRRLAAAAASAVAPGPRRGRAGTSAASVVDADAPASPVDTWMARRVGRTSMSEPSRGRRGPGLTRDSGACRSGSPPPHVAAPADGQSHPPRSAPGCDGFRRRSRVLDHAAPTHTAPSANASASAPPAGS